MVEVIIGGEAVAAGYVTARELKNAYRRVFRGVYASGTGELTLRQRAGAAWLATRRRGVIAGVTAAALHGAAWLEPGQPIEVANVNCCAQPGLAPRRERVADDEVVRLGGLPVTTGARTAFDVGRHLDRADALVRLDAMMWARPFPLSGVRELMERYPRAVGNEQLRELLPLVDGGAATPWQSRARLCLVDAGCPRPQTQVPVLVGSRPVAYLEIGWPEYQVGLTSRPYDAAEQRMLESLGWIVIWVPESEPVENCLEKVELALARRGCLVELAA
ncbi:cullin, a subunit of E3 ubiquitin ligase [Mycolicibacterium phlei]|uniref:Cullin, a subunit of E3 ubiquitin ligase n=1 Tax=Mycolicibacterium phlei DSM 43239 = CCUG 21000 TaxID=1226750 RepID=A0A5N5VBH3_MYCPH|nr:hypothetical protein [Mycolicibacterium phlei]VEG07297.1 cullin, a subunit of E3 ubiquitin ligase [Mycobacteroides chelonae]AMO59165.1 hypothetical protein MPHLCCUG_00324 [Mycolicibacterium phlei]KAB7759096.1 hypothetical protein MPHL21000_04655 [Mycolicibacterium phlei DSM 43239 = CCUG 21000]KXW59684.1 hypothetical protein MPHL43072_11385 [Mycolicibacterium phlei DSM 43072]KXW67580.1 hypothetical protein MPHL43239_05795 [Mycolicibacterium phlei DSM 43239 = CCUG 21000]